MASYAEVARVRVLVPLTRHLHYKPKAQVQRRYEAMGRELAYIQKSKPGRVAALAKHGWDEQRLQVLFALNSFYQCYLGPLHASGRSESSSLGRNHPIMHGTLHFDGRHAREVTEAAKDLFGIARLLDIENFWLALNTCNDVIFQIFQKLRNEGLVGNGEEGS